MRGLWYRYRPNPDVLAAIFYSLGLTVSCSDPRFFIAGSVASEGNLIRLLSDATEANANRDPPPIVHAPIFRFKHSDNIKAIVNNNNNNNSTSNLKNMISDQTTSIWRFHNYNISTKHQAPRGHKQRPYVTKSRHAVAPCTIHNRQQKQNRTLAYKYE